MFEIKIFANPAGYTELKLSNPNPIFSKEIVDRINFDSGDAATFNSGAYSIFYAPEVYVLTHHFDVSSEANFRENRVHIAIALKRGIMLNNVYNVFESLKNHFQELAKTYKDSIQNAVYNDSHSFRSIVQNEISFDKYQLRINLSENRKAIVAYETLEQLSLLLSVPNRKDFIGYNQIYIIPRMEAEQRWPLIKHSYSYLPISNYTYTPTYELRFPNGHIMTIANLMDPIHYECSIKYYKTRIFEGAVKDHFEDWSIKRTTDGDVFEIPLTTLEPHIRDYSIQFIDGTGKPIKPQKGNIVFDGIGEYNPSTSVLRLSGKSLDWAEKIYPLPQWSTRDYSVVKLEPYGSPVMGFNVVLQRYIDYSTVLSHHFRYLKAKVGDSALIYLRHNGSQEPVDENTLQMSWYKPYPPSNVEIFYPATSQFNSVNVKYDGKTFPLPQLEAKPSKKVSIYITNPNLKLENVRYSYSFGEPLNESDLDRVDTYPIEVDWKAGRPLKLRIETSGYKVFKEKYESIPLDKKIEVTLKRTLLSKVLRPTVYIICVLLVFCIGAYCGILNKPAESELAKKDDQIDSLNSVIQEKEGKIKELQSEIEKLQSDNKQQQQQQQQQNRRMSELQKRFRTANFTQQDIKKYINIVGSEDEYAKASRYCLEIINEQKQSDREKIVEEGSELNKKIKFIRDHTLNKFYDKIIKNPDYQAAYITTDPPTGGFKSLEQAYTAYQKKFKLE